MAPQVEVEVDIFSGRPNPVWSLPEPEAAAFLEKLSALPKASARTLSGNLGYRGLVVRVTKGPGAQVLAIQEGAVHVEQGGRTAFLEDEGRALERWLLQTGKPFLSEELFRLVQAQGPGGG